MNDQNLGLWMNLNFIELLTTYYNPKQLWWQQYQTMSNKKDSQINNFRFLILDFQFSSVYCFHNIQTTQCKLKGYKGDPEGTMVPII